MVAGPGGVEGTFGMCGGDEALGVFQAASAQTGSRAGRIWIRSAIE